MGGARRRSHSMAGFHIPISVGWRPARAGRGGSAWPFQFSISLAGKFAIAEAADQVIVDQSSPLHERVADRRSDKICPALDQVLWPVAQSAAELLVQGSLERIRECPGQGTCGWLFLDLSKNASRRWCDMRVCGNRAKARRHYARTLPPAE